MSIRKLLADRDAEFISLHDLLEQMAAEGNATPQEAARFLLESLEHPKTEGGRTPNWWKRSDAGWDITDSGRRGIARKTLAGVVKTGDVNYVDPSRQWEEMSNDVPF